MKTMAKKPPPLTLVRPSLTSTQPPFNLGNHGRSLWDRVRSEYDVSDAAGIELLAQACAGADLAEQLQEEIRRDGAVVRTRNGPKAHPAVKDLLGARSFVVRTLIKLGINYEPTKSSTGRPGGGSMGWQP